MSKDENLTKAHVRFLESRLLAEAALIKRFTLEQNQAGGSKLPESDREDMEVFLERIKQLLPVLGSDILAPLCLRTIGMSRLRRPVLLIDRLRLPSRWRRENLKGKSRRPKNVIDALPSLAVFTAVPFC